MPPFPGINRTEYFQKLKCNLPTNCVLKKWLDKVDEFMNFVDEIHMYVIFARKLEKWVTLIGPIHHSCKLLLK